VFFISSLAETARAPFDLTEAESELVAGYQTEYSSMSFALFWLGEYANVLLMCTLNAVLFWGGYLPPVDWVPLYAVPGIIWLFAKIFVFFFIMSWVKATVPRYRYDQLMRLGWKIFLPISLFWVFLVSGYLMLTRYGTEENTASRVVKVDANWSCSFENPSGAESQITFVGTEPGVGSGATTWAVASPAVWMNERVALSYDIGIGGSGTMQWTGKSGDKLSAVLSWYDEAPLEDAAFGVEVKNLETGQVNAGPCRLVADQQKQKSV
jgi:NADH dehydrogenase